MGLRITTWNVNGIRNPFQYQPWREKRTFAAMFDILEADIVIFQETKIQRKDLRDDMVLVPGWDCYFSLPRHKKGYSGVVIYTRQSVCTPIRAEEGITGTLCPPNSSDKFCELSEEQQIGGYPSISQLTNLGIDFAALDSEGRCVILEFPAFVLIGVYSPASRDESREDFRHGFLDLLDVRVRNLVAIGKRIFLAGDLNISREELDTAHADTSMRKSNMTRTDYYCSPARRMFNHLLEGGIILGERDERRGEAVLWDICRAFHPTRQGMFTCWEQKVNARPGNFGSRIDYVLCSLDMKGWFLASDIQEGLLGSDHCPVYATIKDKITLNGKEVDVRDVLNPRGMFVNGQRKKMCSMKDMVALSGRLIPEFDRRQSIRDMFSRKPSLPKSQSSAIAKSDALDSSRLPLAHPLSSSRADKLHRYTVLETPEPSSGLALEGTENFSAVITSFPPSNKRSLAEVSNARSSKRVQSVSSTNSTTSTSKGQQSVKGFFKPKSTPVNPQSAISPGSRGEITNTGGFLQPAADIVWNARIVPSNQSERFSTSTSKEATFHNISPSHHCISRSTDISPISIRDGDLRDDQSVHDPIESKESWSKLFTKPVAPRCEGHNEHCISLLTKKNGINCGRSFWICPRPLGPTGAKEKNTQWRCQTFIWCSDWNSGGRG